MSNFSTTRLFLLLVPCLPFCDVIVSMKLKSMRHDPDDIASTSEGQEMGAIAPAPENARKNLPVSPILTSKGCDIASPSVRSHK
jgi:hypothetical protein